MAPHAPPPPPVPLRRCYGITQEQFCNPVFWCLAGLSIVALVHDLGRKRSWQDRGVYGFFTLALAASMIVRALLHQFVGGYSSVTGEGTAGYDWVDNTWEMVQSVLRNGAAAFLAADNVGWGGMRHAFAVGAVFSALCTAAGVYLDLDRWRSHGGSNSVSRRTSRLQHRVRSSRSQVRRESKNRDTDLQHSRKTRN